MQKALLTLGTLILLSVYGVLFYLTAKAVGFLMPALFMVVTALCYYLTHNLPTKKEIYKDGVSFDTTELNLYFPIIIIDLFAFIYFFNLPESFQNFNLNNIVFLFLLFSIFIPSIVLFKVILSNKDDRVVFYKEIINWFDNKEKYEIKYADINSVEVKSENIAFIFPRYYIRITLKNENELSIHTHKMNITKKGVFKINEYIQLMISNKISLDDIKLDAQKLEKSEDNINSSFQIVGQLGVYILYKFILYMFVYGIIYLIR
jgi:hypothetical protein